jgi:hypothetical protein
VAYGSACQMEPRYEGACTKLDEGDLALLMVNLLLERRRGQGGVLSVAREAPGRVRSGSYL